MPTRTQKLTSSALALSLLFALQVSAWGKQAASLLGVQIATVTQEKLGKTFSSPHTAASSLAAAVLSIPANDRGGGRALSSSRLSVPPSWLGIASVSPPATTSKAPAFPSLFTVPVRSLALGKDGQVLTMEKGKPVWESIVAMTTAPAKTAISPMHRVSDYSEAATNPRRGGGGALQPAAPPGPHNHQSQDQGGVLDINKATQGVLQQDKGGVGFSSYTNGDLLVGDGGGLRKHGIGSANQVLTVSGSTVAWQSITSVAQGGNDARYVQKAGDTMTGALRIHTRGVGLSVSATISGSTLVASTALASSGTLSVAGAVTFTFLPSCTALQTASNGAVSCNNAVVLASSTGSLKTFFDANYFRTSTGSLKTLFDANYFRTSTGALQAYFNNAYFRTSTGSLKTLFDANYFRTSTGSLKTLFDANYLRTSTGSLRATLYGFGQGLSRTVGGLVTVNSSLSGSLVRFSTVSGSNVFAKIGLTSSGTILSKGNITSRGTFSGAALTIMAGNSSFLGNVGIGTTSPGNKLTVTAPTIADALADVMIGTSAVTQKGLVIQGKASQSANLQEWQNSVGTPLARIDSVGNFFASNIYAITTNSSSRSIVTVQNDLGNQFQINMLSSAYTQPAIWANSAVLYLTQGNGIFIDAPTNKPVIFSQNAGGNETMRISGNGFVGIGKTAPSTKLDVAGTISGSALTVMNGNSYFLGKLGIGKSGASNTALEVEGTISGSALVVNGTSTFNGAAVIANQAAGSVGLTVKGAASQTANLQEWQNSAGTVVSYVDSVGSLYVGDPAAASPNRIKLFSNIGSSRYIELTTTGDVPVMNFGSLWGQKFQMNLPPAGLNFVGAPISSDYISASSPNYFNQLSVGHGAGAGVVPGSSYGLEVNAADTNVGMFAVISSVDRSQPLVQVTENGLSRFYIAGKNGIQAVGIGTASPTAWLHVNQAVNTSGSPTALLVAGGAHTTLTASTEATDINFNLARTVQFAAGALPTQRAFLVQAPTYGFVGASTITNAATMEISGAPIAGTNATITNAYGLRILAGQVTAVPLVVKGAASQTADLQEWQNSAAARLAAVDATGQIQAGTGGLVTKVVSGACADGNFTTKTDGTMCIDSTDGRIYFRYGGAWHYAAQTAGFQIPSLVRNGKNETEGLSIGDPVIGRIDERMADGALHGIWEKLDLQASITATLQAHPELLANVGKTGSGGNATANFNPSDLRDLTLQGALTVFGNATFKGDVAVQGTLALGAQQGGETMIKTGEVKTVIRFPSAFPSKPVTTVTMQGGFATFAVFNLTNTGFVIRLQQAAETDLTFSWLAIPVTGGLSSSPVSAASPASSSASSSSVASTLSSSSSTAIAFPIDSKGVPISSDAIWNACIRSQTPLGPDGKPYDCNRYHRGHTWTQPDLHIDFDWDTDKDPPVLTFPAGYQAVVTETRSSSSSVSAVSSSSLATESSSATSSVVSSSSFSSADSSTSVSSAGAAQSSVSSAAASARGAGPGEGSGGSVAGS